MLFPEPVTPATRTSPWSNWQRSSITSGRYRPLKLGIVLLTRRATRPTCPICVSMLTRKRHCVPSTSSMYAKSAPPSSAKIFLFLSSISGKQRSRISCGLMGSCFNGRKEPATRTYGGCPTLRCRSLPSSFTTALKILSTERSVARLIFKEGSVAISVSSL